MDKNYPVEIRIKTIEIQQEQDPAKKQILFRQLRVLEYQKEIEDIKKRIQQLNQQNTIDRNKE